MKATPKAPTKMRYPEIWAGSMGVGTWLEWKEGKHTIASSNTGHKVIPHSDAADDSVADDEKDCEGSVQSVLPCSNPATKGSLTEEREAVCEQNTCGSGHCKNLRGGVLLQVLRQQVRETGLRLKRARFRMSAEYPALRPESCPAR